jgi:hypothetical protein
MYLTELKGRVTRKAPTVILFRISFEISNPIKKGDKHEYSKEAKWKESKETNIMYVKFGGNNIYFYSYNKCPINTWYYSILGTGFYVVIYTLLKVCLIKKCLQIEIFVSL